MDDAPAERRADAAREFAGKTALVTGAGKGIGRATAQLLAARGARVVALSRTAADLATLADETGCATFAADLADVGATRAALASMPPVDLLVNCAGIAHLAPFVETSAEALDLVMAVNVRAPMLARGVRGAIVNVSSIAAQVGTPLHAAYCASKGALDALTRVMAVELGEHGIRANAVDPVITLTPMAERAWSDPAKSGPMLARIPLQRFAEPLDVAHAIVWLLGDGAAMVNGVSLPVDGGFRAR
ncbi:NAD(P)-dependent dehydrogenase (short-subunit alcohol dehydrogenase family) [Paraburkholderia caballeronis]|uniref:SDR family oxidoreductase n=1 Tax=Paraburkholderia caballeronis TaxID=416943 RepID=UPI0010656DEC|nr:SDR family oxidoreductase [Paraburkholderia caballeronis]TDV39088.1 NAD(P)-dependent dehydrogenase (short-subunit alcohol dehydrogenase family) [Paraburkholderia caballeronis]